MYLLRIVLYVCLFVLVECYVGIPTYDSQTDQNLSQTKEAQNAYAEASL